MKFIIIILLGYPAIFAQTFKLTGTVYESKFAKPLEYTTIKVADTLYGTTADKNGNYILRLPKGSYKIIFSMVGYFSDTQDVFIEDSSIVRNVYLNPSEIFTETIEVLGEDPAYDIIRKAIRYKKEFKSRLNEYDYNAYTKYIIRSDLSPLRKDSLTEGDYPILALMESETKGYFKKPDHYKEIVKAKRESANTERGVAIPLVVNFYDDVQQFGDLKVTSPLADDALDYYEFHLDGITSIDSVKVFKIQVIDGAGLFPLYYGHVYIMDSIFALVKVDLNNNDAAKPLGIDEINFKQKFTSYNDAAGTKFWMPTDVQINAKISFAGVFRASGDAFTIISTYNLNKKAPPGIFDEYVIKVLPDAKKDSAYWKDKQLVKNSKEENEAYLNISKDMKERKNKVRFGLTSLEFGRFVSSNPLSYYSYNRVEGSRLGFNLDFADEKKRNSVSSNIAYGFSDKKMKYEINYNGSILKDHSLKVSAGVFSRLQPLPFNDMPGAFRFFNTATSLLDKRDYYDYYYSAGWNLSLSKFPAWAVRQIGLTLRYSQEKQTSAYKNTDYSFRKHDQPFRDNPLINEAFLRMIGVTLLFDPNKYSFIDYGEGDMDSYAETNFPTLSLGWDYSPKKLSSTYEFRKYSALIEGRNYFNRLINLRYSLGADIYSGDVPYQQLGYFNSGSSVFESGLTFKTMNYREFLGDKIYYFNIENHLGSLFWSKIKFIRKWDLVLFYNAGKSEISNSNMQLASFKDFLNTDKVFMEAGFGIGNIFDILRLDFAWRLTNRTKGKNFGFKIALLSF